MGFLGGSFLKEGYEAMEDMFQDLTIRDILSLTPKKIEVIVSNYLLFGGNIPNYKVEILKEVAEIYGIEWKIDNLRSPAIRKDILSTEDRKKIVDKLKQLLKEHTKSQIKKMEQKIKRIQSKHESELKKLDDLLT